MNPTNFFYLLCLAVATYLSAALTHVGIDKFYYLLAGGKKFATFPDLASQLTIGLSYLLLSILYLMWLLRQIRRPAFSGWRFVNLLVFAAPFLVLAWIAYPLGNDVYIYLHSGLMNLGQANPYLVRAAAFTTELSPYVDWGQTSTYGPVSQAVFTLSSAFVLVHTLFAVYVYKTICLALHIFNSYLIWRWLPIAERNWVTIAYLLHPLLLMEQVSSAHVDIFISTSLIGFAIAFANYRYWSAFSILWAGFLAKTLPIMWTPIVAIALLRRGRWQLLLQMAIASLGMIAVLSFTAFPSLQAWQSLFNPGVSGQFQSSLHAFIRFLVDIVRIFIAPPGLTLSTQRDLLNDFSKLTTLGFLGFYTWRLWRSDQYWNHSIQSLVEEIGWITLVLMLLATSWLMPWYSSIFITLAALIPRSKLFAMTSLAFALSSSAQYVLVNNSAIKSFVSIGLPVAVFLMGKWLLRASNDRDSSPRSTPQISPQSQP